MENKLVFEPTTLTQYHWNKYNIETTYTYYWKIYTAIEDYLYTYFWNKYEVLPTQAPTWNKYDAAKEYAYKYYWDMYNATQKAHKHYKTYKSYPVGDWTINWDKAVAKYSVARYKKLPEYQVQYRRYEAKPSNTIHTYYKGEMCMNMKNHVGVDSAGKCFCLYYSDGPTLLDKRISASGIYNGITPRKEVYGYKMALYPRLSSSTTRNDVLPFDEETGLPDTSDNRYGTHYPYGSTVFGDNTSGFRFQDSDYMFYDSNGTAYTIIPNSYYDWDTGKMYNVVKLSFITGSAFNQLHYDEGYYQSATHKTWSLGEFKGYCWMTPSNANSYGYTKKNVFNRTFIPNNTANDLAVVSHQYRWYEYQLGYDEYTGIYRHSDWREIDDYLCIFALGINAGNIYTNRVVDNEHLPTLNNIGVNYSIEWCPPCNLANNMFITQELITTNLYKSGDVLGFENRTFMDTAWIPDYFIEGNLYYERTNPQSTPVAIPGSEWWDEEKTITYNKDLYPQYEILYIENTIPYYAQRSACSAENYNQNEFSLETLNFTNVLKPNPSQYHTSGYNSWNEDGYIYINPTITLNTINSFNHPNEFIKDEYCETNTSLTTNDYLVDSNNFIYNYREYIGVEHYWEKGSSTGQQVSSFTRTDYPDDGAQDGRWYIYKTKNMEETGEYIKGSTSYGKVYSANTNTYPQNGKLGDYWYIYAGLTTLPIEQRLQLLGEVSANNRNQYPDDGVHSDSYFYRYTDFTRDVIGYHRGEDTGQTVSSSMNTTYPMNDVMDDIWYSYDYSVPHYNRGSLIDNVSSYIETSYPRNNYILNDAWYIYTGSVEVITGQLTIDKSQLMGGVNYTQEINPSEDLMIGAGGAAQVDFTIYAPDANAATQYLGKDFIYYVKMPHDSDWRQVGVFTLTKAELPDKQTAKIEGFDYIYKFDVVIDDWLDSLTFPMTLGQLFNSLCQYVGCEAYSTEFNNSNFVVNDNFEAVQITGRTILQYITEVSGGFCVAEPDGRIHIKQYSIPPTGTINLGNDSYVKYTHEIYNVPVITSVIVRKDDEDEGVESNV